MIFALRHHYMVGSICIYLNRYGKVPLKSCKGNRNHIFQFFLALKVLFLEREVLSMYQLNKRVFLFGRLLGSPLDKTSVSLWLPSTMCVRDLT